MSSPPISDKDEDQTSQEVAAYTRNVKLVQTICACPNCPYCSNKPMQWHVNRRYCCEDARLHHRKLKRAEKAVSEGREPGRVGRPRKRSNS